MDLFWNGLELLLERVGDTHFVGIPFEFFLFFLFFLFPLSFLLFLFKQYADWSSEFYTVLRRRVSKRLRVLNKPRRGSYELWAKALVLLVAFWCALVNMCVSTTCLGSLLSSIAMGATASFIGTCIQHDGSHGAFSTSSWLNTCAGWTLDMIGVRDLLASFFQSSFNLLSIFFQSSFNRLSIVFQSSVLLLPSLAVVFNLYVQTCWT